MNFIKNISWIFVIIMIISYTSSAKSSASKCSDLFKLLVAKFGFGEEINLNIKRMLENKSEAEIKIIQDRIAKLPNISFWDLNIWTQFKVLPTKEIIDIFEVLINSDYENLMYKSLATTEKLSIAEKRALLLMLNQRWYMLRRIKNSRIISQWFSKLSLRQIVRTYYKNKGLIIEKTPLEELIKDTKLISFSKRALFRYRFLADMAQLLIKSNSFNIETVTKALESRITALQELINNQSKGLWKMYNEYQLEQAKILLKLLHTTKNNWKAEYKNFIKDTTNKYWKWFLNLFLETERSYENLSPKIIILGLITVALGYGSFTVIEHDEEYPTPPIPNEILDDLINPNLQQEQQINDKIKILIDKLNQGQINDNEYKEELKKIINIIN